MKPFSSSWKGSIKPGKQRKYRHKAPYHVKRRLLRVHLAGELRKRYGKRSVSVRKNDLIKVLRGQFRGKSGKVNRVDSKECKVYVDGIEVVRREGAKAFYPLEPSNLELTELESDDKKRMGKLQPHGKKTS